jgi:hypothetical protein
MAGKRPPPTTRQTGRQDVDNFLKQVAATPTVRRPRDVGRLLFAMDATASREPTWDTAMNIQAEMFQEAGKLGGVEVQLVYYRGFQEFEVSPWASDARGLLSHMTGVSCRAGRTQIHRILRHACACARKERVKAVVFVGDCCEEDADHLGDLAGQLGLLGVPCFIFREGQDPNAKRVFEHIAKLTGGACVPFDPASPDQLRDLLAAVAVFAAGGRQALRDLATQRGGDVKRLTRHMG